MKSVMIVAEDAYMVGIYTRAFEASGYDVVHMQSAEVCLERLSEERPSAIVLSLVLEQMNGFSLLEQLRVHPNASTVPAFVLTRLSDRSDIRRCHELGCRGYFIKPHARPTDLLQALERELGGSQERMVFKLPHQEASIAA